MGNIIKNKYFWIILVLVIIYFAIVVLIGTGTKEGKLIISNISSFTCRKNGECEKITQEEVLENNESNYVVYEGTKNIGEYKLDYISKWNFFDLNGNWQNVEDGFIAASTSADLIVKEFETREMNDSELALVNKLLVENDINSYSTLSQNEVLEYDFDKNSKNEKIIIASNITDESEDEKLFTIVISVIKNKASIVAIDINKQYENFSAPAYNIKGIINLFKNKQDYLVITKGYYSEVGESVSFIYKVDGKSLENIVRN